MFTKNKHTWMMYNYVNANDNTPMKMWIRGHDTIHQTENGFVASNKEGRFDGQHSTFEEAEVVLDKVSA